MSIIVGIASFGHIPKNKKQKSDFMSIKKAKKRVGCRLLHVACIDIDRFPKKNNVCRPLIIVYSVAFYRKSVKRNRVILCTIMHKCMIALSQIGDTMRYQYCTARISRERLNYLVSGTYPHHTTTYRVPRHALQLWIYLHYLPASSSRTYYILRHIRRKSLMHDLNCTSHTIMASLRILSSCGDIIYQVGADGDITIMLHRDPNLQYRGYITLSLDTMKRLLRIPHVQTLRATLSCIMCKDQDAYTGTHSEDEYSSIRIADMRRKHAEHVGIADLCNTGIINTPDSSFSSTMRYTLQGVTLRNHVQVCADAARDKINIVIGSVSAQLKKLSSYHTHIVPTKKDIDDISALAYRYNVDTITAAIRIYAENAAGMARYGYDALDQIGDSLRASIRNTLDAVNNEHEALKEDIGQVLHNMHVRNVGAYIRMICHSIYITGCGT